MKIFLKKRVSLLLTIALVLISAGGTWGVTYLSIRPETLAAVQTGTAEAQRDLFDDAVKDAMTVEAEEILPLVSLEKGAPYAVYDEDGRVLLLTFHKYPDSYPQGAEVSLSWGDVWTFTPGELADWYEENKKGVTDWDMRLRQLIGLTPDNTSTHFTAMWVSPGDVERPAYVQKTGDVVMTDSLAEDVDEDFKEWFDGNIIWSYFDSAYPWTRLGYTYDWADNGKEYGLSEFLVKKGCGVKVAYTVTAAELIAMLENGSWLPEETQGAA